MDIPQERPKGRSVTFPQQGTKTKKPRKSTRAERTYYVMRKIAGVAPEKSRKSISKAKSKWRKFYNEDRYYHAYLELDFKVNAKEAKQKAKDDRKKEQVKQEMEKAELIGSAVRNARKQVFKEAAKIAKDKEHEKNLSTMVELPIAEDDQSNGLFVTSPVSPEEDDVPPTPASSLTPLVSHNPTASLANVSSKMMDEMRIKEQNSAKDLLSDANTPPLRIEDKEFISNSNEQLFIYYRRPDKVQKGSREGRRIVLFDGKLKRVSDINTANETFHVVFHFYLTWLMSKKEVEEYFAAKATSDDFESWEPSWAPVLECDNRVEGEMVRLGAYKCKEGKSFKALPEQDPKNQFAYPHGKTSFDIRGEDLGFDPRYAFWCRVQYNCELLCAEELELEFFPFDCQDMGVYLRLKDKADKCDILPFPRHGPIFNIDAPYSMVSEWRIPGVMLEFEQGEPKAAKDGIPYNSVIVRVKAERKWQAHLADSITIFCMFWLGLSTFGIPVEDVGDRLAYCITLLLADIATMQLLNETTPTIPYRTFLDTYTYACFLFLVAVTIFVTVSGFGGEANIGHALDWWGFWLFFIFAVAMHIWFLRRIYIGRADEQNKLEMDSDSLEGYFQDNSHMSSVTSMPSSGVYWNGKCIAPPKQWRNVRYYNERGLKPPPILEGGTRWKARSYPWASRTDDAFIEHSPWSNEYGKREEKLGFLDGLLDLNLRRTISIVRSPPRSPVSDDKKVSFNDGQAGAQ